MVSAAEGEGRCLFTSFLIIAPYLFLPTSAGRPCEHLGKPMVLARGDPHATPRIAILTPS